MSAATSAVAPDESDSEDSSESESDIDTDGFELVERESDTALEELAPVTARMFIDTARAAPSDAKSRRPAQAPLSPISPPADGAARPYTRARASGAPAPAQTDANVTTTRPRTRAQTADADARAGTRGVACAYPPAAQTALTPVRFLIRPGGARVCVCSGALNAALSLSSSAGQPLLPTRNCPRPFRSHLRPDVSPPLPRRLRQPSSALPSSATTTTTPRSSCREGPQGLPEITAMKPEVLHVQDLQRLLSLTAHGGGTALRSSRCATPPLPSTATPAPAPGRTPYTPAPSPSRLTHPAAQPLSLRPAPSPAARPARPQQHTSISASDMFPTHTAFNDSQQPQYAPVVPPALCASVPAFSSEQSQYSTSIVPPPFDLAYLAAQCASPADIAQLVRLVAQAGYMHALGAAGYNLTESAPAYEGTQQPIYVAQELDGVQPVSLLYGAGRCPERRRGYAAIDWEMGPQVGGTAGGVEAPAQDGWWAARAATRKPAVPVVVEAESASEAFDSERKCTNASQWRMLGTASASTRSGAKPRESPFEFEDTSSEGSSESLDKDDAASLSGSKSSSSSGQCNLYRPSLRSHPLVRMGVWSGVVDGPIFYFTWSVFLTSCILAYWYPSSISYSSFQPSTATPAPSLACHMTTSRIPPSEIASAPATAGPARNACASFCSAAALAAAPLRLSHLGDILTPNPLPRLIDEQSALLIDVRGSASMLGFGDTGRWLLSALRETCTSSAAMGTPPHPSRPARPCRSLFRHSPPPRVRQ
ncbi:hypothetical protein DFH07DRAFT_949084 [Mycena maculata]|uniref:Uncharacterized protein n=1 Tax=Mycena maculata TaxID=230809 RepID=A0AAD7KDC9_9AGAR|nr:hypothetical protein DFH07DRAFT_949084 [Mycena maculata]